MFGFIKSNTANIISLAGVAPLALLFLPEPLFWLPLIIVLNNLADDLDGLVAGWLKIRSRFGANLDNVCDAVAHGMITIALAVSVGGLSTFTGLIAACSVILRSTIRLDPACSVKGTPTNELMRHCLIVILLAQLEIISLQLWLPVIFLFHTVTMLLNYPLPFLIRSFTKSSKAILLLNLVLLIIVVIPLPWIVVSAGFVFIGSYLVSILNLLVNSWYFRIKQL